MESHSFDSLNLLLEPCEPTPITSTPIPITRRARGGLGPGLGPRESRSSLNLFDTAASLGPTSPLSSTPQPFSSFSELLSPSSASLSPHTSSRPLPSSSAFRASRCVTDISIASLVLQPTPPPVPKKVAVVEEDPRQEPAATSLASASVPPPAQPVQATSATATAVENINPKQTPETPSSQSSGLGEKSVLEAAGSREKRQGQKGTNDLIQDSDQSDRGHLISPEQTSISYSLEYIIPRTPVTGTVQEIIEEKATERATSRKEIESSSPPQSVPSSPKAPSKPAASVVPPSTPPPSPPTQGARGTGVTPSSPPSPVARFASFNSLVQAAARPFNMGLTGDGRTRPSTNSNPAGGNSVFGGRPQGNKNRNNQTTTAASDHALGGIAGSELVASIPLSKENSNVPEATPTAAPVTTPTPSTPTPTPARTGFLNFARLHSAKEAFAASIMSSSSAASLRSSASSFIDGPSSRPSTPGETLVPVIASIPTSPPRAAVASPLKVIQPPHPALVNEFEGLDFEKLIKGFLPSPASSITKDGFTESEKLSPQARLEDLASTAHDLLDRVYTAYLRRTSALEECLAEQGVLKEEVEEGKVKIRHLRAQLEKLDEEAQKEKEEKDEVITVLVKELENEKIKIEEERKETIEERQEWEKKERDRLRQEIVAELLAKGTVVGSSDDEEDGEGVGMEDVDMTPRQKRSSMGAESSDSGFDESSDTDSFYSTSATTGLPIKRDEQKQPNSKHFLERKSSLTSIMTTSSVPVSSTTKPTLATTRRGTVIRIVPPSILNGISTTNASKCENCARTAGINSSLNSPKSTLASPTAAGSVTPTSPTQVNPLRYPTPLSKRSTDAQQTPSTPATSTSITSRWGFGVLRGGGGNGNVTQHQQQQQTQHELDRLRCENKGLRERVGDLEKSVDEVLGVLGGWRKTS